MGLLTHSISSLTAGTTYYFTARASNTAGDAWAPVRSFLATSNDPPSDIFPVGSLSMDENLNIGSVVVDFNTTDPRSNPILLALVDQSPQPKTVFSLWIQMEFFEPRRLDYETNASAYTVRIRVTDQLFAYREENLSFIYRM